MRERADSLSTVHSQPDVALAVHQRLAGVKAHPDQHLDASRPRVSGQAALRLRGGGDRLAGTRKDGKQRVSLGVDDAAAVAVDDGRQQARVIDQQARIVLTQTSQQGGRTLDVGEHERDGAGRHRRPAA